jgi:malate dehydrogenase (oxaloacetate-decarboxylating)(NADP+)
VNKTIGEVKLAVSGAGAAAIACLDVMVGLGVDRANILVCDSRGVIHERDAKAGRLDESKQRYCQKTDGAHPGRRGERRRCVPGLLGPGVLTPTW